MHIPDATEDALSIPLVLFTLGSGLSTPAVFRAWDGCGAPSEPVDIPALAQALRTGEFSRAQTLSHNDLEALAIALMPEIGASKMRLHELVIPFVHILYSGSTVFAAFRDESSARAAVRIPGAVFTRTLAKAREL